MTDIHSHILPAMDDGSSSPEESAELLLSSAAQGITLMAATSHFYAHENTPEEFLKRRGTAVEKLQSVLTEEMPDIVPGAEVQYFTGISRAEQTEELRILGTGTLLVEMPFTHWTKQITAEIAELQRRKNIQVVLAHVERYLPYKNDGFIAELTDRGVLIQSNASWFLDRWTRNRALRMLKRGEIDLIASDCHNTRSRPQQMEEACRIIGRRLGREFTERAEELAYRLLDGGKVIAK